MSKQLRLATTFLLLSGLSGYTHAITIDFDFTAECDDCAFLGNPGDAGFNPLNDGLTETVTGTLSIVNAQTNSNGFIRSNLSPDTVVSFTYNGSSLINPFTMTDPYLFTNGLLTTGAIEDGFVFEFGSTQNITDPGNPQSFNFPDFCTSLGQQVLGFGSCSSIGDVTFALNSTGGWSISGEQAADIGTNGQLVASAVPLPGAVILFASGLIALVGFMRKRTV